MKDYIIKDEWKIIEDGYNAGYNQITESLLSLGNGKMGQRANFEESYSGKSLRGSYIAGVYYPDKTRVGWWKNGYPEYFAKVLNSCNWIGIEVIVDGEQIDIAKAKEVKNFRRELDMQKGLLSRTMDITLQNDAELRIDSQRFVSMDEEELGMISYKISSINYTGVIQVRSYLDFDVVNQDSNYDENFWIGDTQEADEKTCYVQATTKKTGYTVGVSMNNTLISDEKKKVPTADYITSPKKSIESFDITINKGESYTLIKSAGVVSSMYYNSDKIKDKAVSVANIINNSSYEELLNNHIKTWSKIWDMCDIQIEGDISAQQAIRFNIYQLYQTYTGQDDRLNIGPKGFTGEKYGGSTYWDTEAYCLPFYLSTSNETVAKNLLIYRYKQLDKAIENASKLGFDKGAALYPMVTMTGEECHNEWEITFEEIHRNGAIAYAIYDYIRYTDDTSYIAEYGLEVLVAIARFWAQRVNWSEKRLKYVMLGVTGPNEYENNVNNNWYTNYIATWCLQYAQDALNQVQLEDKSRFEYLINKISFKEEETIKWKHIVDHMYYPADKELGIYLQQDNFLDKEQILAKDLDPIHRPINQNWSWDRILRSCFIKQADVLQGMYFFEDHFDEETHRKNYEFYEPKTVHESSLSPCVHGILASKLGMADKAYEMYLRTARLDLDDYNNDTEDGCHITSMAGTWLAIVKGFGGQRIKNNLLSFTTNLPKQWDLLSFKIKYRSNLLEVKIEKEQASILNISGPEVDILVNNTLTKLPASQSTKP